MSASVNELLAGLEGHPDVTVEVTTGLENWRKGLVVLAAKGDGTAEVLNRVSGKESRKAGKVAPAALKALAKACAAVGIPTLKSPPGPREPGDTPVVLRVRQGARVLAEANVWYADRYDNAALDKVVEAYDAIVSDLTGGELPY